MQREGEEIEPYVLGVYLKAVGRTLCGCRGVCQTVMFRGKEGEKESLNLFSRLLLPLSLETMPAPLKTFTSNANRQTIPPVSFPSFRFKNRGYSANIGW